MYSKKRYSLAHQVVEILYQHYSNHHTDLIVMVGQLLDRGRSPVKIENLVSRFCPAGSQVPSHLYQIAAYLNGTVDELSDLSVVLRSFNGLERRTRFIGLLSPYEAAYTDHTVYVDGMRWCKTIGRH